MKNMTFEKLNQELENRGIVFEAGPCDEYETCCYLEGMYEWGFTTVTYCIVIDPIITFFDWKFQSICSIDLDSYTTHRVTHGVLYAETKHLFMDGVDKFCYDLKYGAPVHVEDIHMIGVDLSNFMNPASADRRFYALKDGNAFLKEDGVGFKWIDNDTVNALIKEGFTLINQEDYQSNVDALNNEIIHRHLSASMQRKGIFRSPMILPSDAE